MLSNIRVTYSGLIAFAVGIGSLFTGMVFTLIVTRNLIPEEFGAWSIIGGMIGYFLISEPIISYWSTRQIARGEPVAKTSLYSSIVISMGSVPFYLLLVAGVSDIGKEYVGSMLLATFLLPASFISQTLMGINLGHKPHATSYSIIIFEFLKIPSGFILVYFLDLGLNGAIIATLISYLGKIIIQIIFAKSKLSVKFDIKILIRWIKLSWMPLYGNLGHVIWSLDVVIFPLITSSLIGLAYYASSIAIASIIAHSEKISQAIYPKLLAKGSHDHIQNNFTKLMYFAIPLLGITILFAKPALYALNPQFAIAFPVVMLLGLRTFFYAITGSFYKILLGIENVDLEHNTKYSILAKSKLFLVPTLTNIHYSIYVVTLIISLLILKSQLDELELVITWGIISALLSIPFALNSWLLVRKYVKFSFPYKESIKYIFGTVFFSIVYYFTNELIIHYDVSIYKFLPGVLFELIICSFVYIGITYIIDIHTRVFLKSIIREIRR